MCTSIISVPGKVTDPLMNFETYKATSKTFSLEKFLVWERERNVSGEEWKGCEKLELNLGNQV